MDRNEPAVSARKSGLEVRASTETGISIVNFCGWSRFERAVNFGNKGWKHMVRLPQVTFFLMTHGAHPSPVARLPPTTMLAGQVGFATALNEAKNGG
jgi:hypothetical protein